MNGGITLKKLGTEQQKLSAAETWDLTLFCADACVQFKSFLGFTRAERLLEAGRCCERFVAVLRSSGTHVPDDALQERVGFHRTCRVTDALCRRVH